MAKAGRPKKDSAKLPVWFDIQKYADVKNFDTKGWSQQLSVRKILFESLKSDGLLYWAIQDDYVPKFLDLIVHNPIIIKEDAVECSSSMCRGVKMYDMIAHNTINAAFKPGPNVRGINKYHVVSYYNSFKDSLKKFAAEAKMPMPTITSNGVMVPGNVGEEKVTKLGKFLTAQFYEYGQTIIAFDVSVPHEILKAEFEDFLQAQSNVFADPGSPIDKSRDFDDWFKCGILPYLDLKLWELTKGESFHWETFGVALTNITKMRYGSDSAHMKAIKACEKLLMDERTLRLLQSQAAREEAGRLQKSRRLNARNPET